MGRRTAFTAIISGIAIQTGSGRINVREQQNKQIKQSFDPGWEKRGAVCIQHVGRHHGCLAVNSVLISLRRLLSQTSHFC
mmetsp:Transcript_41890/g.99222  ORF Transcript_41890/g.99222 Transcript_41890/m.99222 type:complete len:80 (+) Transcript_41890:140-379(+)